MDSSQLDDLVNTAEFLIKAVQDSYAFVVRNQVKVAVLLIPRARKEDGSYLSQIAESQKEHFESQLERYRDERDSRLEDLGQQRKKRHGLEEEKSDLLRDEWHLMHEMKALEDKAKILEGSLKKARIADARLKEKPRKGGTISVGGVGGATIGGLIGGPFGAAIGSYVGLFTTTMLYEIYERNAERDVLINRDELKENEFQMKNIKKSIESVEKDIKLCEEAIRDCDNKIAMTKDNITTVNGSIQFTENVICLWKFFNIFSQSPLYCINKLQEIVQMVEIRQKCQILTSEGTTIVADTFLSAWKVIIKNSSHQCIDKRYAIINKIMHYTSADCRSSMEHAMSPNITTFAAMSCHKSQLGYTLYYESKAFPLNIYMYNYMYS